MVGRSLVILQVKYYWFHFQKPKFVSKFSYYKSNILEFLLFFLRLPRYSDVVGFHIFYSPQERSLVVISFNDIFNSVEVEKASPNSVIHNLHVSTFCVSWKFVSINWPPSVNCLRPTSRPAGWWRAESKFFSGRQDNPYEKLANRSGIILAD